MNIKKKLQRFLTGILTLCMVMSIAYIPMQVRAQNENLKLGWSGATVSGGVFTGANGTATLTIDGTQYGGNSSSVVINSLDTVIVVKLTANEEGKKGVLRTEGGRDLSFPDDAAVTVGKVTTYTFTLRSLGVADLATFVALNVDFEDNNPGGGNTEAPTDAISVELWDNSGNLLDYGQYSSTEVPVGLPVIGAKIQYSYNGNAWNELANSSDANLVYYGSRYVFPADVAIVYLKVISVERGFLVSAALEGINDGYKVWEGPVENGKVYILNEQKPYDLKFDDGNTPSTDPVKEPTKIEETTKTEEVHAHSYSWVTVQEAGAGQDGMEEYRCSCGDVKERSVIPASQVFVKGLYGELKNASLNGTVTFDTGRLYTLSDYLVKKLAERSDVTVEITFEYEKKPYKMIIPAGVDYAALLDDEENFYGYFYFAKVTGATIEER